MTESMTAAPQPLSRIFVFCPTIQEIIRSGHGAKNPPPPPDKDSDTTSALRTPPQQSHSAKRSHLLSEASESKWQNFPSELLCDDGSRLPFSVCAHMKAHFTVFGLGIWQTKSEARRRNFANPAAPLASIKTALLSESTSKRAEWLHVTLRPARATFRGRMRLDSLFILFSSL